MLRCVLDDEDVHLVVGDGVAAGLVARTVVHAHVIAKPFGAGHNGSPDSLASKEWLWGVWEHELPHFRVESIGADEEIEGSARSVGEFHLDLPVAVVDRGETCREVDCCSGALSRVGKQTPEDGSHDAEAARVVGACRLGKLDALHDLAIDVSEPECFMTGTLANALLERVLVYGLERA